MDDAVALKRLEALLEGVGVDAVCQLCLVGLENASPPTADARCEHRTCARCIAALRLDDGAWGSAGCPSCEMDNTDAGMTRMFGAAADEGEAPDEASSCRCGRALLTRESFRGVEAAALAGVFVAERRAVARAVGVARRPSPRGDSPRGDCPVDAATAFWGRAPSLAEALERASALERSSSVPRVERTKEAWVWWDCGAQIASLRDALPSARAFLAPLRLDAELAVVSNGSALLGSGFGRDIDAGDAAVARFNEYETAGFTDDVGARTTVHVTGWLLSASREDPGDRLAHEEPSEASVEIRLAPNVETLARAYYVSYARAVAHHGEKAAARFTKDVSRTPRKNARLGSAEDGLADAWWRDRLETRRAPVAFVAAPSTYARHWTHVRSDVECGALTKRRRAKRRVTSGYAFLLLALDFAGLALPGDPEEAEEEDGARAPSSTRSGAVRARGSVRLYGFEDDPRNARDGSGGHFWDPAHAQHHAIYDLPWERDAARELAATRRGVSSPANPAIRARASQTPHAEDASSEEAGRTTS